MDIQKPYSREVSPNYSYPVTENFEYSSITSAFESLLLIDQVNRAVLSTEPHSVKLTFKVKKLASAMKSTPDPFTSFFSYIPQALKQDLTPIQVISTFVQDFTSEISDFPIALCSIPVSKLLSHTGRPQEVFEKEVPDGKAKIIVFELNWDTDATMENVSKVIKCIPGNIQSQGFMEIASIISCTSNYYSTICKSQENWKSTDKFADKEPVPWVKVAWMMVSGLKYPNVIVYQRVEGYKSTANFITSLDFENLVKFSKKQDERAKIIVRNTDGIVSENKNFETNKFVRPNSETKEMYTRLEANYNYSKGETGYNYGIEPRVAGLGTEKYAEDSGRKAQTPIMRKYDYLENKPLPVDDKIQALNEKYSFKPSNKFDLPKPPYRKEEYVLEKTNSPKNKEDSFRAWNRNDEMERIHLGSPKDKEYPQFRAFSRQEESYPKLSFTPQRNMSRDIEKFTHISPKESEEPSPYFREKLNFQEKYSELIKDNKPIDSAEDRKPWGERQNFREDPENFYKNRPDSRSNYKTQDFGLKDDRGEGIKREDLIESKSRDLYKDPLSVYKNYSDLNKKEPFSSELPPRGAYRNNNNPMNKDEQSKKPLSVYEELNEKYKFLDNKDPKSREGNYLSDQYKTEDIKPKVLYEEPQDDDYRFKEPYYEKKDRFNNKDFEAPEANEGYRAKLGFDYKTSEETKKKDLAPEGLDRNRFQNYKYSEQDYRTDIKTREILQDSRENYRQDIETNPPNSNYREIDRDPYEKYKPYTAKDDNENQYKKPYTDFSLQNPDTKYEDYKSKARELYKPSDLPPNPLPLEPSKPQDPSNPIDWNCAKCNKKVQGSSYECSDCRLINWDQFYKVKSQQHCKTKTEDNVYKSQAIVDIPAKDDQGRRMYSFSDNKEEESAEWVCTSCNMNNKNLFFLCKSCRKPRLQNSDTGNEGRKEYKLVS